MHAFHDASGTLTPSLGIKAQSISAATVNGTSVDLASKGGAYFAVTVGNVTDPTNCTWTVFLQESSEAAANFTNVNTTTYPEATIAASNSANTVGELHYTAGPGRKQYVRAVATTAVNAVLLSVVNIAYPNG
jgi:hypothetical protein